MYESHASLPRSVREVHKVINKSRLIGIAGELDLDVSSMNVRQIVLVIANDLEANGIPEDQDCSDELYDFLVDADYIDEDGNILEEQEGDDEVTDVEEEHEEEDVPECFTYAEQKDPACARCKLYDACYKERIASRPACFGIHWDMNSEECKICLEFGACRQAHK